MNDLRKIKEEYETILNQLSDPELISDWERFEELSKRKTKLEKFLNIENEINEIQKRIEENKLIITAQEDQELCNLAESENIQLLERKKNLEEQLQSLLNEEKEKGPKAILVEIRAGAGGEEAALFASDLFRMYSKYAQKKGWRQRVLDSRSSDLGGLKEIIFELKGDDVFAKMKYEAGVHRVQRIPETEKQGRIHTSTASVAILPKPQKAEIKINPKDIKIDFYRASGPGGQYVNKRETAVRITHLPTGIVVTSQTERNQLQNKENALAILEARLLEKRERDLSERLGDKRRSQIGRAQRAEKIRTYNFPQDRITDHRIKKTWHNLEKIMEGDLDIIISVLEKSN